MLPDELNDSVLVLAILEILIEGLYRAGLNEFLAVWLVMGLIYAQQLLAYPVGQFSNGTKALARQAGYQVAYSYCTGASFLRSADLLNIRRVAVEVAISLPHFWSLVAAPFCSW